MSIETQRADLRRDWWSVAVAVFLLGSSFATGQAPPRVGASPVTDDPQPREGDCKLPDFRFDSGDRLDHRRPGVEGGRVRGRPRGGSSRAASTARSR